MKRVNLIDYFNLSDGLNRARAACSRSEPTKAGRIYLSIAGLVAQLGEFINEDNGFNTTKHVARELLYEIDNWISSNIMDSSSPPTVDIDKFDNDLHSWQFSSIADKVDHFKSVFTAECREVEIYSIGQISIYRTNSLVSNASHRIPEQCRKILPKDAMDEFDSAGKCLAFELTAACGFHALRGVELVILEYLNTFGAKTSGLKTWNDYVKAVQKLIDGKSRGDKPSSKVGAMIDRMRDLDRNPLMHPRDTLDATQADLLFSLAAITSVEMARDMERVTQNKEEAQAYLPEPNTAKVRSEQKGVAKAN